MTLALCYRVIEKKTFIRLPADDPPKPPPSRSPLRRAKEGWRRWVWFWGTTGLPVGLYGIMEMSFFAWNMGISFFGMPLT
jgi:hypothetical protein